MLPGLSKNVGVALVVGQTAAIAAGGYAYVRKDSQVRALEARVREVETLRTENARLTTELDDANRQKRRLARAAAAAQDSPSTTSEAPRRTATPRAVGPSAADTDSRADDDRRRQDDEIADINRRRKEQDDKAARTKECEGRKQSCLAGCESASNQPGYNGWVDTASPRDKCQAKCSSIDCYF